MMRPEEAQRFLGLLDSNTEEFTFQTFGEGKADRDKRLTRILHGRLRDILPELKDLNSRGAGVFVTVNETDGKGRKVENITRIRAVWQEDDDGWRGSFPLEPSIEVESSPGKFHRYWLLERGSPSFAEVFPLVMAKMVSDYGSDRNAKDVSRILRLPGFLHQKGDPVTVRIVEASGRRYSENEILSAFPPSEVAEADRHIPEAVESPDEFEPERLHSALYVLPADNRDDWFRYGAAIHDASDGSREGFDIWDEWSQTTATGNYDSREQQRYWDREFPKRNRGNRTTVASIFHDARSSGWMDGPQIARLDVRDGVNLDGYFQVGPNSLSNQTIRRVRERFAEWVHDPSEDHWKGLRDIARVYELMAKRACPEHLFMSSLPPGMGKTTVAIESTKALLGSDDFGQEGVIYFLSRLEEIRTLVKLMGLDRDDFSALTSDQEVNALGNPVPERARVLFTTQQRLEAFSKDGAAFADMRDLRYRGKPRAIRVWDEAILPSMTLTLDKDGLFRLLRDLRRVRAELADTIEDFAVSLREANGPVVTMPDIDRGHIGLDEFRSYFESPADKDVAEALWYLSGRVVRVRRDNLSGTTSLDYEDILPPDLAPMLILDASGGLRKTYGFWKEHRKGLELLHSPQKSYSGLTIHHWDRGAGKSAHGDRKSVRQIADGVAHTIAGIPDGEEVLVVHHKPRPRDLDIVNEIKGRLSSRKGAVSFCNWGRHTATNQFAHIRHVILAGVLQYNLAQYEAAGRAAKAAKVDDDFSEQEFVETRIGEIAHHIFQAACRGYVRKTVDGGCPSGCHLYVIFSTHRKTGFPREQLSVIFPASTMVEWSPVARELSGKVKEAVSFISEYLERNPKEKLPTNAVMAKLGISDRGNWNNRVANHRDFESGLTNIGVAFNRGRGRGGSYFSSRRSLRGPRSERTLLEI